jgi:hypothetical protein
LPLPRAADGRLVLAVDVSPWLRPGANTCAGPSFCHAFGRGEGKHQMVPGWPYSVVAALETGRTPWTGVLDAARLEPGADVAVVTTVQIHEVVERLVAAGQWKPGDPEVLVVLDAGYDAPASPICRMNCQCSSLAGSDPTEPSRSPQGRHETASNRINDKLSAAGLTALRRQRRHPHRIAFCA